MNHAVILAGGSGTRLWPLSRRDRPKQLLRLFDGASLLQIARRRVADLFVPECTWISTSAAYIDQVAAELPDIPRENLIGEPVGRDTANAIGLAAHLLALRDPDATMAVFTADHIIRPQEAFAEAIRRGLAAAESMPTALVTFGIRPTSAHAGYGYIRRGAAVSGGVYRVARFVEKPAAEVAGEYLRSGEYYWNSGMFCWRAQTILESLANLLPENAAGLARLAADWRRLDPAEARTRFEQLRKISIDYAVMERAPDVLVAEMNCDWRDVGSWPAIAGLQAADAHGNQVLAPESLLIDAQRNIVVSEEAHLLVLLGVDELVVIHSDDATLICRRDQVERMRDLGEARTRRFGPRYD